MRNRDIGIALLLVIALATGRAFCQSNSTPAVKNATLGQTRNVHACGNLFLAGQPTQADIATIKAKQVKRVITLRADGEIDWDEGAAVEGAGLQFVEIPFRSPDSLTDDVFGKVRKLLQDADKTPTLLHCGSANRVGAVWLTYRVLDEGVPSEIALKEAETIGLRSAALEAKALDYIKRHKSVRPGINDRFLDPTLNVEEWLGRFEVESREVYGARGDVLKECEIRRGSRVADIGAGTGFFTRLFSDEVKADGWVFAVDISPRFIEHINEQAKSDRLTNVTAVLCQENSISLPPESIDVAFVCDTYHHFEYLDSTLASIHRALRPGGTLIVIDFERIPGKSREFILNHVRAGKEVFRGEIVDAGFTFVEEVKMPALKENYLLRFRND